jgi:glycosyltransferase involved in cell wall biosynthesis
MNLPLVTIAIPTFNRADQFLKDALESALSQTYKNIEIVVSDNCSSDNTEELIRGYKDKRIRYYRQDENIGPFKNMNFCLEKAQGVYFLMLHDDDLIDEDCIERCLEAANYRDDIGIIVAGSREIDLQGNVVIEKPNSASGISPLEFLIFFYEKKVHLYFCSILFNTAKLRELGGFKEYYRYFVDLAAEFEMIGKTERVDVTEVLGSFRAHVGSFGNNRRSRSGVMIR